MLLCHGNRHKVKSNYDIVNFHSFRVASILAFLVLMVGGGFTCPGGWKPFDTWLGKAMEPAGMTILRGYMSPYSEGV